MSKVNGECSSRIVIRAVDRDCANKLVMDSSSSNESEETWAKYRNNDISNQPDE